MIVSVIETVQAFPELKSVLVDSIKNGKINIKESQTVCIKDDCKLNKIVYKTPETETNLEISFPTSSWTQFCILFSRMILQLERNKLFIALQLSSILLCSLAVGLIFYQIGNNGSFGFSNFLYCVALNVILLYVYLIPATLSCKLRVTWYLLIYNIGFFYSVPMEIELLKREYLNRWYRLSPYVFALTLKNLLLMVRLPHVFDNFFFRLEAL